MRVLISFILLLLLGCKKGPNNKSLNYNLNSYYLSSKIKKANVNIIQTVNSIELVFSFEKSNKNTIRIFSFRKKGDAYFYKKIINHFEDSKIDTVDMPYFFKKDTSYNYILDVEKYQATLPEGFEEWRFTTLKKNNLYILTKQHLKDPNFKEDYSFDDSMIFFNIKLYHGTDTILFSSSPAVPSVPTFK
ncbi:MAG: hypothetical protein H7331_10720 [Bacteroidia bacterium]|nr:hypothetical protein [Bacteroidia bacterium]